MCIYNFAISEISKASYKWMITRGANSRDYTGSFNVALKDNGTTLNLIANLSTTAKLTVIATYY